MTEFEAVIKSIMQAMKEFQDENGLAERTLWFVENNMIFAKGWINGEEFGIAGELK